MAKRSYVEIVDGAIGNLGHVVDTLEKGLVSYRKFREQRQVIQNRRQISADPRLGELCPIAAPLYEQLTARLLQLQALVELTTPRETIFINSNALGCVFLSLDISMLRQLRLVCKQWNFVASRLVSHIRPPSNHTHRCLLNFLQNARSLFTRLKRITLAGRIFNGPTILRNLHLITHPDMTVDLSDLYYLEPVGINVHTFVDLKNGVLLLPPYHILGYTFKNVRYVCYCDNTHSSNVAKLLEPPCSLMCNMHRYLKNFFPCYSTFKWQSMLLTGDRVPVSFAMPLLTAEQVGTLYLGEAATLRYATDESFREIVSNLKVKLFDQDAEERIAIFGE